MVFATYASLTAFYTTQRRTRANATKRLDVGTVTWDAMEAELGFEYDFLNASYAAALAGLATGCILFAPAALVFGRKPVYLCATLTMVLVNVGQAIFATKAQYIVLQVLAGLAGSINDTIIQITVSFRMQSEFQLLTWVRYRISSSSINVRR